MKIVRSIITAMPLITSLMTIAIHSPVSAQSVTEARFVLADIKKWLPGRYDNEPQIFLETSFGAGPEGNHEWRHIEISEIATPEKDEAIFLLALTRRDKLSTPVQYVLAALKVDEGMRAVRMDRYLVSAEEVNEGRLSDNLKEGKRPPINGVCPIYWRQGPGYVYGSMPGGWCETKSGTGNATERLDMQLTAGELVVTIAARDRKRITKGRSDEVPNRYTKVRMYDCFINILHADGKANTTINPFTMHDGGDVFTFQTKEATPRKIDVLLRRSMWTSRSGRNFVPLLQLWVYENDNRTLALAGAWADSEGGRVGWESSRVGGGRCKVSTGPGE